MNMNYKSDNYNCTFQLQHFQGPKIWGRNGSTAAVEQD